MPTQFQEKIYKILKKVPKGQVTTYKALAKKAKTKAFRAVGSAMKKNPIPGILKDQVPCHRVINSNGNLGGFAPGVNNKIKLLKKEGIQIINNKVDLKKYGFKFN